MSRIRQSARGEECQVRMPFVCNGNPETTVLAHANGSAAGKGIGMKSIDELSAYACSACHDVIDRRRKPPPGWTMTDVKLAFWEGHARTYQILKRKGLV